MTGQMSRQGGCLLQNLPERLVLEGYRHWMAGYETGSIEPWERCWNMFTEALGHRNGRDMLAAVSAWARECYMHARQPPQTFPFNCRHICRHECMAMASVAALQHEDEQVAKFCLEHLVHSGGVAQTRRAAWDLADTLSAHGHAMMPVPFPVIASIAMHAPRGRLH